MEDDMVKYVKLSSVCYYEKLNQSYKSDKLILGIWTEPCYVGGSSFEYEFIINIQNRFYNIRVKRAITKCCQFAWYTLFNLLLYREHISSIDNFKMPLFNKLRIINITQKLSRIYNLWKSTHSISTKSIDIALDLCAKIVNPETYMDHSRLIFIDDNNKYTPQPTSTALYVNYQFNIDWVRALIQQYGYHPNTEVKKYKVVKSDEAQNLWNYFIVCGRSNIPEPTIYEKDIPSDNKSESDSLFIKNDDSFCNIM